MSLASFHDGEKLITITAEHWIKYVVPVLVAAMLYAITFLLFLLAGLSAHHYMWLSHITLIAAMVLFVITHHWFFMNLLSNSLDRVIVTNRRLLRVQYTLLFQEDILEISFEKMKTVDARKHGLLQNILHYGTLVFESKLATVPLVPHPNRLARRIQEVLRG